MWRMMILKPVRQATRKLNLPEALNPRYACRPRLDVSPAHPLLGQRKRPPAQHCLQCLYHSPQHTVSTCMIVYPMQRQG